MGDKFGIVKMGIAFITFVGSILAIYFQLKNKVEQLGKENRDLAGNVEKEKGDRTLEIDSLKNFFKVELKDEVDRVQQTLQEYRITFSKLFNKVEAIGENVVKSAERLENHVNNQEKICKIRHNETNS